MDTFQNHREDETGREREMETFTEPEMSHASIRHRGRSTRIDSDESSADSGTESSVVESVTYEGEISLIGGIRNGKGVDSLMENRGGARVMEENFKSGEDDGGWKGKVLKASRFANRASTPTHRRVKESPLSSDSIFNQVSLSVIANKYRSIEPARLFAFSMFLLLPLFPHRLYASPLLFSFFFATVDQFFSLMNFFTAFRFYDFTINERINSFVDS